MSAELVRTIPREQELDMLLRRQARVISRRDAVRLLGAEAVRWRVSSGRWQRPHRGVLVAHNGPLTSTQTLWVDLISAGRGAVLAGPTAAAFDGLRGHESPHTYVLIPAGRQVTDRDDLVVHRSKLLGSEDVHPLRMPPRTRLARSILDAARWAVSDELARAVLAAGVQQRLVRPGDLHGVLTRLGRVRRRRLVVATLDDIAGGSHALPEIEFLRLVRRHRLPEPDRQVVRLDEQRRRRWLDAYFAPWRVVVEIDGLWHTDPTTWWADMRRQNALTIGGEVVLRFPSFAVREQPDDVAAQLTAALRANGWMG